MKCRVLEPSGGYSTMTGTVLPTPPELETGRAQSLTALYSSVGKRVKTARNPEGLGRPAGTRGARGGKKGTALLYCTITYCKNWDDDTIAAESIRLQLQYYCACALVDWKRKLESKTNLKLYSVAYNCIAYAGKAARARARSPCQCCAVCCCKRKRVASAC